jgi:putative transposase
MASSTSKPKKRPLVRGMKQRHHCVYALNYHLVLVTKYRRKCLTAAMLEVIEASARERCASRDGEVLECNGEPVLWSRSYCAISVGGAPLDVLKRYIEQQDRPH